MKGNFSISMAVTEVKIIAVFKNVSIKINKIFLWTQVRPIIFVEKNKIYIYIKEFQTILDMFPKEVTLIPIVNSKYEGKFFVAFLKKIFYLFLVLNFILFSWFS